MEKIMDIRPIRTDTGYRTVLKEVETLMTAESRTVEGDKLDILGSTINQNLLCRLLLAVLFMLSAARLLVIFDWEIELSVQRWGSASVRASMLTHQGSVRWIRIGRADASMVRVSSVSRSGKLPNTRRPATSGAIPRYPLR